MFVYTLGDIIGAVTFVAFLLYVIIWTGYSTWVQWRCKHEKYYETMACDAICCRCHKNLGFIGTVREQRNGIKS